MSDQPETSASRPEEIARQEKANDEHLNSPSEESDAKTAEQDCYDQLVSHQDALRIIGQQREKRSAEEPEPGDAQDRQEDRSVILGDAISLDGGGNRVEGQTQVGTASRGMLYRTACQPAGAGDKNNDDAQDACSDTICRDEQSALPAAWRERRPAPGRHSDQSEVFPYAVRAYSRRIPVC